MHVAVARAGIPPILLLALAAGFSGACDCEEGATPAVMPAAPATEPALPAPAAPAGDQARPDGSRRRGVSEIAAEDRAKLLAAVPHIREGQRLGRAGSYAAALAAFERALAEAPDDPGALCEAGWQAFRLERLDRARELLERGARLSRIPSRRAACLYNLGRVHEGRGEVAKARARYAESLRLRPNDVVAERLAGLSAADEGTGDDGTGDEPTGDDREPETYASLETFCDNWVDADNRRISCDVIGAEPFPDAGTSAELLFVDDVYWTYDWTYHYLLLRTAAGLTLLASLGESETHGFDTIGQQVRVEDVSMRQVIAGGEREVIVTLDHQWWDDSAESNAMWECDERGLEFDSDECRRIMDESGGGDSGGRPTVVGCARIEGRWCCRDFGERLPAAADFAAEVCGHAS